jgi:hypothetical protein
VIAMRDDCCQYRRYWFRKDVIFNDNPLQLLLQMFQQDPVP